MAKRVVPNSSALMLDVVGNCFCYYKVKVIQTLTSVTENTLKYPIPAELKALPDNHVQYIGTWYDFQIYVGCSINYTQGTL